MKTRYSSLSGIAVRISLLAIALVVAIVSASAPLSAQEVIGRPEATKAAKFDISPPLRTMIEVAPPDKKPRKAEDDIGPPGPVANFRHSPDPVIQRTTNLLGVFDGMMPGTLVNFEGISNPTACNGCSPPDPNGDIGPNHYVQMVNLKFQIFDRAGNSLFGPVNTNTLWAGFGGRCETGNAGDPIVLYDQFADRWLLSQFSPNSSPFFNCVAISTSPDPTGTYYRYAFSAPSFPDYPKYGIGRDAYYINTNEGGTTGNYALDRNAMLAGSPTATAIRIGISQNPFGLLPVDIDGNTLPPAGHPHHFIGTRDTDAGGNMDAVLLYKFTPNFTTPASSTFTGPTVLPAASFDSIFPCTPSSRACIPQPGTTAKIDTLSYRQRPTFRATYRNFGTHESILATQSVEATTAMAGMRWYEVRDPNGTPTIHQQGTYAPGATDGIHRWMGAIASDRQGNIALGYSVSAASTVFPGIRYTGRLATDPLGTMPQGEGIIIDGGGSQTSTGSRWGDYSSMNIDPVDDCTFWYTTQYYATTSTSNWRTRIASFKFPSCTAVGVGFEGDVAPRSNGDGIILTTDVAQLRRFASGLDIPDPQTNEGQRGDCAPLVSSGDGIINASDVIQGRRFATGLDPLTGAGGPQIASTTEKAPDTNNATFAREIRVVPGALVNGRLTVDVELSTAGDEMASGFTLEYDTAKLRNPQVSLAEGAPADAVLTINLEQNGKIGLVIDSAQTFAGSDSLRFVTVTFDAVGGASGETAVSLTSSLAPRVLADAKGNTLATRFVDGRIDLAAAAE